MSKALSGVRKHFDTPLIKGNRQSIAMAVAKFRSSGELKSFLDVKYVCIAASETFSGWRVLQDAKLLSTLLEAAGEGPDRRRLKCISCLLRSYWSYPRFSEKPSDGSQEGWLLLQRWLSERTRKLNSSDIVKPLWFQTLCGNLNLLGEEPCKPYHKDLLLGESARLNQAFIDLGIPADSWLREEAVFAQIQAAAALDDAGFRSCITRLLKVTSGETDFKISKGLSTRCIAGLVSRYATCSDKSEHIALRDAAISYIGNPWLHRAAWDSRVLRRDGTPDDEARQMLNAWLKVRLIKDFFDLLSEDRSTDGRRLNYWLRFEPVIDDMWFALGSDAMTDKRTDYVEFRKRAKGRLLDLVGATPPDNNAFLMRIGQHVIVEFSKVNNACFIYEFDGLSRDIKRRLGSDVYTAQIDICDLKVSGHKPRLSHLHSWEPEFDSKICSLIGFTPPSPRIGRHGSSPAQRDHVVVVPRGSTTPLPHPRVNHNVAHSKPSDFEKLVSRHHLKVSDLRSKGGCLWILTDYVNPQVRFELVALGFMYKAGKGWWKE
jgi:hypothetical protein